MSAPAAEAVDRLRAIVEHYVDRARDSDGDTCRAWADTHHRLADLARERGDVDAELLHVSVAAMYRAHLLAALAAAMIAEHGHDPLGTDRDPRDGE